MKRSQVQMMETIIVLFVFFVLIAFGFVFYSRSQTSSLQEQQEQFIQQEAVQIAQVVSFLPELQCSEDNVVKENCIDLYKINALTGVAGNNPIFYYDLLGFSKINVIKIYPPLDPSGSHCIDEEDGCVIYDRKPPGYDDILTTHVPISIRNPVNNHRELGIMIVQTYT